MAKKLFLTPDGLFKGIEGSNSGVVLIEKYNIKTRKYESAPGWEPRKCVMSLDDIWTLKAYCYNSILKHYRKTEGLKPPYIMLHSFLSFFTTDDGGHADMQCGISKSYLEYLMEQEPEDIYLDFWPYQREGNPRDWSEFEPLDNRVSADIMVFNWKKDQNSVEKFIAPIALDTIMKVSPTSKLEVMQSIHDQICTNNPFIKIS